MRVYLRDRQSASYLRASSSGFETATLAALGADLTAGSERALVAMLIPDSLIGPVYREHLALLSVPVTLVLAHGYAVYAGELAPNQSAHVPALLAPKAIGPKLRAAYVEQRPNAHSLVAAVHAEERIRPELEKLAAALGFAPGNLVDATFAQEAVGDLISEQALLCGGLFTLLEWTMNRMRKAGVPDRLVREECLTELELIAGMLRAHGPAATLSKISAAAQCGTVTVARALADAGTFAALERCATDVESGKFAEKFREGSWREEIERLKTRLALLEGSR